MLATLSPTQLKLLQHLHLQSGTSGGRIGLDPKAIMRALRIKMTGLADDAAALESLGLAGVRHVTTGRDTDGPIVRSATCSAVWLTKLGEDYLKRLHAERPKPQPAGR
jgi:hypothetical protein